MCLMSVCVHVHGDDDVTVGAVGGRVAGRVVCMCMYMVRNSAVSCTTAMVSMSVRRAREPGIPRMRGYILSCIRTPDRSGHGRLVHCRPMVYCMIRHASAWWRCQGGTPAEPRRQRRHGVCISGSSFDGHASGQRHDLWCVAFCRGEWCMGEAESCAERPSAGRHRPHIAGKTSPHGYRVRGGMMC